MLPGGLTAYGILPWLFLALLLVAAGIVLAPWLGLRRRPTDSSDRSQAVRVSPVTRAHSVGGVLWRLAARQALNAESRAKALYQIDLTPVGAMPDWRAGDIVEIPVPEGVRQYSVASVPEEGMVRLLVRQGGHGAATLTDTLQPGDGVALRFKTREAFHAPPGDGPLLLIGAGSGLAGLRAHIVTARASGRRCWLIYGERNPVTDGEACDELYGWQDDGTLLRLDLAFSAVADGSGRYVQDILVGRTADLKDWLSPDGAVLVCGSRDMGRAIDGALRAHLGDDWVDDATASGRYRRDLY